MTPTRRLDPVAAVRAAVLARATADAERTVASADREVAARLAEARSRAAEHLRTVVALAEDDAAAIADEARARARRQARALVLAARQTAVDLLRSRARAAVRALRGDPGYPALLARLTETARDRLGAGAAIEEHPDGGVLARVEGRRLALTLDAAADRALDALGAGVEELWRP